MRRMPLEKENMRRVHHSATSVVQRDDVHVAVVACEPVNTVAAAASAALVAARNAPASSKPAPVVARHEGNNPKSATTATAKNEARGSASAAPSFQWRVSKDKGKRKNDASDANVAREPVEPSESEKTTQEKREPETQNKRQLPPHPTPVRPIMTFR
ncbi:hypothetical protein C0992_002017 [Termitomyces sp. T32_za158]|nr:hypothetical protein C0992_002017 [Termitomyces sp. T32_za158]